MTDGTDVTLGASVHYLGTRTRPDDTSTLA
jgi:hypothetical protein